jgi:16S rRNA (cytosine967-C5)-methyltransferase
VTDGARRRRDGRLRPEDGTARAARGAKASRGVRAGRRATPGAPQAGALTARGLAINALVEVERGERANEVLPALLAASTLDQRDRSFATELVYGTLRMRRACDWLVDRFARGELDQTVRAAARAGAYQLAFMRVPSYAAVSATVEEVPRRARGLMNVVLRRIGELADAGPIAWPDLGTELSYPDWVIERLSEDLGRERALEALAQMNLPASAQARADGYIQDPGSQAVGEEVARWWAGLSEAAHPPRETAEPDPGPNLVTRPEHGLGKGQGRAALVDMCAAPGGKATLLARHVPLVVACDISSRRADLVAANAARLGLAKVAVAVADGNVAPFRPGS